MALITIICQSCGGSLRAAVGSSYCICEYCGTQVMLPSVEKSAPLIQAANHSIEGGTQPTQSEESAKYYAREEFQRKFATAKEMEKQYRTLGPDSVQHSNSNGKLTGGYAVATYFSDAKKVIDEADTAALSSDRVELSLCMARFCCLWQTDVFQKKDKVAAKGIVKYGLEKILMNHIIQNYDDAIKYTESDSDKAMLAKEKEEALIQAKQAKKKK